MPFDAHSPNDRLQYILQNAKTKLLLCDNYLKLPSNVRELLEINQVGLVDFSDSHIKDTVKLCDSSEIYLSSQSNQPAYILYTSGSTANQPKGVIQTRQGVYGQIKNYTDDLKITDKDNILQLAIFTHDQAVVDYFGALLNGCTLCLYDLPNIDIFDLHQYMKKNNITIFIPITLQDANSNSHLAANFKRFSIEKPHNTMSIIAVFLNQNV